MNAVWPRFLRAAYRKEPISSFIVTVGAVDVAIGGLDSRWSLFSFGLGTVGLAIALRWWLMHRQQEEQPEQVPQYYLPPRSSRQQLPILSVPKKNPPSH